MALLPLLLLAAQAALLTGCAATGPDELIIEPGEYETAFDAAVEATRRAGMPAVLRDRRGGVIETETRIAGSLAEPWRWDNASLGQSFENTANFQRRRAQFLFAPADAPPPPPTIDPDAIMAEPDYIGALTSPVDLTGYEGAIRLSCVVVVERNHRTGIRRSTWTRRQVSQTKLGGPDEDLPTNNWTASARDDNYARRLLARVNELMAE